MASSNKHLSTHVYFHMDRSSRPKYGSGFNISGPLFEAQRGGSNNEKPRNKENTPLLSFRPSQLQDSRTSDTVRDHPARLRFIEPSAVGEMGREHSRPDYDDFDAFCQTPTMLSPEVFFKEKNKRKLWHCGSSKDKYEMQYEDCLQPFSHRSLRLQETALEDRKRTQNQTRRPKDESKGLKRLPSATGSSESAETSKHQDVQDCIIIPAHLMGRFMPFYQEGQVSSMPSQALSMIELKDPKICIIIDFGENAAFASHDHLSPTSTVGTPSREWISTQLDIQRKKFECVRESQAATEGMLLINVERCSQFPFMTYLVLNTNHSEPNRLIEQLEDNFSTAQCPEQLQHLAVYEEVATIARLPLDMLPKTPTTDRTGYIISAFRVLPGEDREKLEQNWLTWTGARHLYKSLPKNLGLRRITFHKRRIPDRGITYVLLCECADLMSYVTEACVYVDQLRARCCGYIAFFRVVEVF
ncbi:uncharacterized protein LOC106466469 [Limulus polyphemus]|uniref:Uncharacterized protein LOC106466469 n=1 Tax=Limulus polyphemus TaxID=6850 RepID=A0ABM1BHP8_LIMPO|nr:uncharacterized protein LOC106466469 [Limulus polyphemus]